MLSAVTVPSQFYLGRAIVEKRKANEIPVARESHAIGWIWKGAWSRWMRCPRRMRSRLVQKVLHSPCVPAYCLSPPIVLLRGCIMLQCRGQPIKPDLTG